MDLQSRRSVEEHVAEPPHHWGIGDPQTTFARFQAVLEARGLLDDDGRLSANQHLLAVGDYFDFPPPKGMSLVEAGEQGVSILQWLAQYPAGRVPILMGNHDAARVMELSGISDTRFAEARRQAEVLDDEAFCLRFPSIPTRGLARRDFSGFSERQRGCVQRLLTSGRMKLAQAVRLQDGRTCLVTHAGVTRWVLTQLGMLRARDPQRIAGALNGLLSARVAEVAADWAAGRVRPLDLGPIHRPGTSGVEGGGLLYHRMAETLDDWSASGPAPRRFLPGDVPEGLLQAVGHTQHKKMVELLPEHVFREAADAGQLRRAVFDAGLDYGGGVDAGDAATVMWFFDGGLHFAPPSDIELMPFSAFLPDRP